jgi:serine/threonine protein kinase
MMNRAEYIQIIYSNYDLVNVLSKKNGGEILRLRHKTLNQDIVLRSYPHKVESYRKLKSITHPNIPLVYDYIEFEDGVLILEEFIDGITVSDLLKEGKYTYYGAKKVISAVCEALITLHSMDVIHRDIKPENVIVTKNGEVKLIDFNAARIHTPKKKNDTVVLGTIGYAPPEQFGISQSDKKSDIYSVGVLLNVMLTGLHPSEKLAKGRAGKIVLKCTQIDPESRFQSAQKLKEAL